MPDRQDVPRVPDGFRSAGAALWRRIVADVADQGAALDGRELSVLREACELRDTITDLRVAVERDGVTVKGSTGQPRVHPAVEEIRLSRLALRRLLDRIEIPDAPAAPSASQAARSRAASVAARTRWTNDHRRRHSSPAEGE